MSKRAFIDTNILLDLLQADRPCHEYAKRLMVEGVLHDIRLGVCAMSLKDTYYILCKRMREYDVRKMISELLSLIDVVAVDRLVCQRALVSDEPDFEDGIVRACAERWKADYIISRDEKAYANSHIKRVTAEEYLRICGG